MPVLLPVKRTTDMGSSRADDSTPGSSQFLERERPRRREALRFYERAPLAPATQYARLGSIAEPCRAVRPRAPRRMRAGYIACSLIASPGAVVETDNDPDTLWEGGETQ